MIKGNIRVFNIANEPSSIGNALYPVQHKQMAPNTIPTFFSLGNSFQSVLFDDNIFQRYPEIINKLMPKMIVIVKKFIKKSPIIEALNLSDFSYFTNLVVKIIQSKASSSPSITYCHWNYLNFLK